MLLCLLLHIFSSFFSLSGMQLLHGRCTIDTRLDDTH